MTIPLKAVSKNAALVLGELSAGLGVGERREVGLGIGHMAVHLARLPDTGLGQRFSIAHYFQSQRGLLADPELTAVQAATGWIPLSLRRPFTHHVAVQVRETGDVAVDADALRDVLSFCEAWLANVGKRRDVWAPRSR